MSLRSRLALTLMGVVFLTILGVAIGSVSAARGVPRNNVDAYLQRVAVDVSDADIGSLRDLADVGRGVGGDTGRSVGETTRYQVLLRNGEIRTLRGRQELPINELDWEVALTGEDTQLRSIEWNGINYRMITFPVGDIGAIQLARDVDDADLLVRGLLPRIALWGALGAAVAGLVGWFIADRITQPITRLTGTSERVARTQDLRERIPVERTDEVGRLATSFNTMLEALETSQRQQNQLVLDANHELRTPLTSLRTNIEVLQRNHQVLEESDREQILSDVTAELDELTALVSELVDSATALDLSDEPAQPVDLEDLVESCVEIARRRTGRQINVSTLRPVTVDARPAMVTRAIQNLLSNADKFSPADTAIEVDVVGARVTVSDAGPGISPADQPHVFDRFYRATESRSKPGSGLGLAIVKQVAESHGGQVAVATSPAGGAAVSFDLGPTGASQVQPPPPSPRR